MGKNTILSLWRQEYGKWSEKEHAFVDRHFSETREKTLTMKIRDGTSGKVIEFVGGPTGNEAYYVNDLYDPENLRPEYMCICAGTINSWPECKVPWSEVKDFLIENNMYPHDSDSDNQ